RGGRAAGQDERIELAELGVELVAPRLEAVDVVGGDPQGRVLRVLGHRRGQIRADVEQVVLHVGQHLRRNLVDLAHGQRHADRGIGLLDLRVGDQTGIGLVYAGEITHPGGAVVAGTGIDARDVNSHDTSLTRRWPRL